MWEHTTGMSSTPYLTPRARAWFKTQALQLATDALTRPRPDGTVPGWVEVDALTDQLFSTNKAYGAALVTAWMTTHNIPTSPQEKNLKLTREAVNAAFTGNTNYGTVNGKPQPFGIARHVYGLTQRASADEHEPTNGRFEYQVVAHGVTELKNMLKAGVEAKVTAVVRLAQKAILTGQKVTITDVGGPLRSGTTVSQSGVRTAPSTYVERRVRGILQAARLYHSKEDTPYARPGMEWSGIIHDTLTAASTHLDTHPSTDDAALIGAATTQIVADTGLTDPADPAAATHLTALLTGALQGAGLTTPTLANQPNSYLGVQLNAVLTYAKDHGPLTDQDIKILAQQEFATITTTVTTPADYALFVWQVRGWLHGAGLHGAPHPEQPPHPLATRAAQLADQLTARNLPYTPAQIAASLFPHLPAITDHHRDLTATWIDQYTQSHTPPTNTTPSTLDTTGRQITARATLTTWKRDQPQPATAGATGVTRPGVGAGMTASNIPPWPTATTPDVDPVTGLTPAQRSTLEDLSLRTTPAAGATADTFYNALLTATPEQLRNATTPGQIRQHLATQAILDFHTDPAIAARITHAGGLDTVLTHLRDGTDATTATGALVPDLTARHYEFPIDIIDANGDPIPGTGQPRHPTHNPFTTPVTLTHTRQPHTTTTGTTGTGGSGSGSYDHFLPTTADDLLNTYLNLNSNNSGRNNTRKRDANRDPSPNPGRYGQRPGNGGWSGSLFGSADITTPATATPATATPASAKTFHATSPATVTSPATASSVDTLISGLGRKAIFANTTARTVEDTTTLTAAQFPDLSTVNPHHRTGTEFATAVEYETNCVLAAITVDISIAEGEGFTTPPSGATTIDDLVNNTGNRPVPTTYRDIAAHLLNSPPGTRGYLTIETKPGTGQHTINSHTVDGHVINVIHAVDGNVYFLDGQTGGPAHLPDNPTKVEYIPTTTTDTLATPATPAAAAAPRSTPPSAPAPAPGPVLSAGSESAPVTGPTRGDVLFGDSRAPITHRTGGAAVTVDDTARFGEEKERSGGPGGPGGTTTGLTAGSTERMGKGKRPVGIGDLSTGHTTGDDQIGRVETAEPGRLEERFRAEFGRHVDVRNLLKDVSDLLPRIPMVIPDRSPELTAAYRAVQDTKFQVAKLLHAGNHTQAQAEAERLTAEFTRNHPGAFIPGVTTIRARGGAPRDLDPATSTPETTGSTSATAATDAGGAIPQILITPQPSGPTGVVSKEADTGGAQELLPELPDQRLDGVAIDFSAGSKEFSRDEIGKIEAFAQRAARWAVNSGGIDLRIDIQAGASGFVALRKHLPNSDIAQALSDQRAEQTANKRAIKLQNKIRELLPQALSKAGFDAKATQTMVDILLQRPATAKTDMPRGGQANLLTVTTPTPATPPTFAGSSARESNASGDEEAVSSEPMFEESLAATPPKMGSRTPSLEQLYRENAVKPLSKEARIHKQEIYHTSSGEDKLNLDLIFAELNKAKNMEGTDEQKEAALADILKTFTQNDSSQNEAPGPVNDANTDNDADTFAQFKLTIPNDSIPELNDSDTESDNTEPTNTQQDDRPTPLNPSETITATTPTTIRTTTPITTTVSVISDGSGPALLEPAPGTTTIGAAGNTAIGQNVAKAGETTIRWTVASAEHRDGVWNYQLADTRFGSTRWVSQNDPFVLLAETRLTDSQQAIANYLQANSKPPPTGSITPLLNGESAEESTDFAGIGQAPSRTGGPITVVWSGGASDYIIVGAHANNKTALIHLDRTSSGRDALSVVRSVGPNPSVYLASEKFAKPVNEAALDGLVADVITHLTTNDVAITGLYGTKQLAITNTGQVLADFDLAPLKESVDDTNPTLFITKPAKRFSATTATATTTQTTPGAQTPTPSRTGQGSNGDDNQSIDSDEENQMSLEIPADFDASANIQQDNNATLTTTNPAGSITVTVPTPATSTTFAGSSARESDASADEGAVSAEPMFEESLAATPPEMGSRTPSLEQLYRENAVKPLSKEARIHKQEIYHTSSGEDKLNLDLIFAELNKAKNMEGTDEQKEAALADILKTFTQNDSSQNEAPGPVNDANTDNDADTFAQFELTIPDDSTPELNDSDTEPDNTEPTTNAVLNAFLSPSNDSGPSRRPPEEGGTSSPEPHRHERAPATPAGQAPCSAPLPLPKPQRTSPRATTRPRTSP